MLWIVTNKEDLILFQYEYLNFVKVTLKKYLEYLKNTTQIRISSKIKILQKVFDYFYLNTLKDCYYLLFLLQLSFFLDLKRSLFNQNSTFIKLSAY